MLIVNTMSILSQEKDDETANVKIMRSKSKILIELRKADYIKVLVNFRIEPLKSE